jgi:hypothetical protein
MMGSLYVWRQESKLVRDLMIRPEGIAGGHQDQPPIVVLEGGAETGKTALLSEMAAGWIGKVPCSYLDVKAVEDKLGKLPVDMLLAAIAFQLARHCKIYGSLHFHRLAIGVKAMQQPDLSGLGRNKARHEVDAMVKELRDLATLKRVLGTLAQDALEHAELSVPTNTVKMVISAAVDSGASRLFNRTAPGRAKKWYGHQDRELSLEPIDRLIDLNQARHHPELADPSIQINELLCEAFLADLRDNFRYGRHSDEWPLNCLVLLDNVDCDLGQSFLRQLVAVRRHPDGRGQLPDPLVVVGSSRGGLIAAMTPVERVTVRELTARPDRLEPDDPPPLWRRRTLSPLTVEDVVRMAATLPEPYRYRNLATMLHHLTGGHLGGVAFLLQEIQKIEDISPDIVTPEVLLASKHAKPAVEDALRTRLLKNSPEKDNVDTLVTCSAARNPSEGLSLLRRVDDDKVDPTLLPAGMWDPETGAHTTLLRLLLLRCLAQRRDDHPWNWAKAHDALRPTAILDGDQDDLMTRWLHHTLAMGQVEAVLLVLNNRLSSHNLPDWLSLLLAVAKAPFYPEETASPGEPPPELPSFLRPLLTRLWKSFDPLYSSDRSILYSNIARGFNELSKHIDDTCTELLDLIAHYEQSAQQWRRGRPATIGQLGSV